MDANRESGSWRDFRHHLGTAVVLAGGVLMGAVNIYLAASLLPSAVADIGGERLYAWNTTAFLVAQVVGTLLVSRLLGARGEIGAYLAGFGVFAAGSLACALSPAMPVLLAGRGIQGLGAGLLTGLGFAALHSALPRSLWARGSALISAMFGIGNFVGPALGGLFAQFGSWRGAFAVLAGAAVLMAAVVPRALRRGERGSAASALPIASLALIVSAAGAISLAGVLTGAVATTAALLGAATLVVGFLAVEGRAARPILPRSAYRSASPLRWVYLTIVALAAGVSVETFLPLFGQRLGGLPPLAAGFLGAALSLGWSLSQIAVSSIGSDRVIGGLRVAGPVLLSLGFVALALLQRDPASLPLVLAWVPVLLLTGAGIGIAMPHLTVAAMTGASDPAEGATAAAATATVLTMATAFGAAVAGLLVNLGGPEPVSAARTLLFGFAFVAALGIPTAMRVNRTGRTVGDPGNIVRVR
ncbi:MFS transporter [Nocardia sp. CDC159]|uniref:MFS transporter n=1 Tax=Nocardia pulmonis TaxID=2951408 RepID=A0A9X2IXY7_9NOCA|nr:MULTISPECIES: MFS transporter [Nocardia]MCM6775883.1 MFS transporter [Nocardia pulmonis]MCM6788141.1 MFS transporter [Nocardia sp. CDC159]